MTMFLSVPDCVAGASSDELSEMVCGRGDGSKGNIQEHAD